MSWGTSFTGSNNTNFSFPALMNDGRFSNWSQDANINQQIKTKNGITTNNKYRQFLVNNADSIIERNQYEASGQCCNSQLNYATPDTQGINSNKAPYLYNCSANNGQPVGYTNSDLKNLYLSSSELNNRLYPQEVSHTQNEYIKQQFGRISH